MRTFAAASLTIALLALAGAAFASPEAGAPSDPLSGASGVAGFDHIETAHISFNYDNGNFTIPGHFNASSKDTDITADHATGNSKQKLLHADGNVIVHKLGTSRPGVNGGPPQEQRPSTLTCDKLDVNGISKIYTATGNMHFTQVGGRDATADMATLDDANHHLHMQGNVRVKDKDRIIMANTIEYDTISGQIEADGNVTIVAPTETAPPGTAPVQAIKHKKII
jgi:lipopolysaccharide assembly outer membrane protein LptD (OstA)